MPSPALAQCLAVVSVRGTILAYVAVLVLGVGTLGAFEVGKRMAVSHVVEASISGDVVERQVTPEVEDRADRLPEPVDPLAEIGRLARAGRDVRLGAHYHDAGYFDSMDEPAADPEPVWPYGLVFDVALGAGALLVTVRRLRGVGVLPRSADRLDLDPRVGK